MCQGSLCIFEGYEGECNLTSQQIKAILDKFNKEPCPDFTMEPEEKEYWTWIELVQEYLEELHAQNEKQINELLDNAIKGTK